MITTYVDLKTERVCIECNQHRVKVEEQLDAVGIRNLILRLINELENLAVVRAQL